MGLTNVMDDIFYENKDFRYDHRVFRHPSFVKDKHIFYHLSRETDGSLQFSVNRKGQYIMSPRRLAEICIYRLVCEIQVMEKTNSKYLPSNIYPLMLTEAMYQREAHAMEWLISTWPMNTLRVYDILPPEDFLEEDYLSRPMEDGSATAPIDCFMTGILKLRPDSGLKVLDFTGFEKDRKLCKELCRLPILWLKPKYRTVDQIHESMCNTIDVSKDKVQKFLNRISNVYQNIDNEFKHGNKIEPLTIKTVLHITIDDVPLGLSLQKQSPFKFSADKVWMKHIPEVTLPMPALNSVIDAARITHFEYEDPLLPRDAGKFQSLMEGMAPLSNLVAFSFPNSIDVQINEQMVTDLNAVLVNLKHLQRLNLAYCNLQGSMSKLLNGLKQRMSYLNIKDVRLTEEDVYFLLHWRPLCNVRELNLSCNNLSSMFSSVVAMMEKMSRITCIGLSYCQLNTHAAVIIMRATKECSRLKVITMQNYIPLPLTDVLEILHICTQVGSMQKVILFPEVYAYPGNTEQERKMNRIHMFRSSCRYLTMKGRADIELE